jgi:inhibitor of KinA sporulation pathway (predicted exonuclease)
MEPTYYCVLDFEATCWENMQGKRHEIIEFPSVLLSWQDGELTEIDRIQIYVRPMNHPILSEFCTNLTGITQDLVNDGVTLEEALEQHRKWLYNNTQYPHQIVICSIGNWDLSVCLAQELSIRQIKPNKIYTRWIDIKSEFKRHYNYKRGLGLNGMLDYLKMELEGRHHSGIDDCHNTARIFRRMIEDGYDPSTARILTLY